MPALLQVLVGIPGSGKSTLAQQWLEANQVDLIVSSDSIRKELTGSEEDLSLDNKVWFEFHKRIRAGISDELRVACDATHLTKKSRIYITDYLKRSVPVNIYVLAPAWDVCIKRNNSRKRAVSIGVMHKMQSRMQSFMQEAAVEALCTEYPNLCHFFIKH